MNQKLPIDLPIKTITTKVSVGAHKRLKELAREHDVRISDVLSACILHMPDADLRRVLAEQKKIVDSMPVQLKGIIRNMDKLTPEQREMLKDIL